MCQNKLQALRINFEFEIKCQIVSSSATQLTIYIDDEDFNIPKNVFTFSFNPFAALGRLTDQNIDKHLSSYAKSGIDLIIMERQP